MVRLPPRSTRTDTPFPYPPPFRLAPSGAFGVHSVPGTTPYPGASGDANDLVWETPPAGRQAVLWTDDARDLRTAFCGSYGRWFDFRCRVPAALFPAYKIGRAHV